MDLRRVKGMCFHQNRIRIFLEQPLPIEINEREDGEQGPLFRKNIVCRNIFIPSQKPLSAIHVTILLRERGYFYLPRVICIFQSTLRVLRGGGATPGGSDVAPLTPDKDKRRAYISFQL
ncbi:hypothetical protein CEXT_684361 [Caerostris extrusa]|uniref:Uncharacterized protein n=1 Tax=Caerostris extrusa TaxID=172846 RepID=A0AAV4XA33_CAEEX|nr:hypothetical protein CEXT_684361 [Caerostris extrusa]